MTKLKKTWAAKLAAGKPAHVSLLEKPFAGVAAGQKLAIASPQLVRDYVNAIPHGETRAVQHMRETVAKRLKADASCPTSSAIFLRIVAEAALEEIAAGKKPAQVTPFWRLIDPKSPLAKKLSCGPDFVVHMRDMEAGTTALADPLSAKPHRETKQRRARGSGGN